MNEMRFVVVFVHCSTSGAASSRLYDLCISKLASSGTRAILHVTGPLTYEIGPFNHVDSGLTISLLTTAGD
jgi:hypothetical protein